MASSETTTDDSLYPIAVLIDELRNEDVQVCDMEEEIGSGEEVENGEGEGEKSVEGKGCGEGWPTLGKCQLCILLAMFLPA